MISHLVKMASLVMKMKIVTYLSNHMMVVACWQQALRYRNMT